MPLSTDPQWPLLALYAVGAAVLLTLLFKIPRVGAAIRGLFSLGLLAVMLLAVWQQAPYVPALAPLVERLGLDRQEVVGGEVRVRMAPDGHFWVRAEINGVPRRMLIDSGATITALSGTTADLVKATPDPAALPVMIRTANGVIRARTASLDTVSIGAMRARDLKVIVAPGLAGVDVLGMNFLSQLASWRVENRTLILVPRPPAAEAATTSRDKSP